MSAGGQGGVRIVGQLHGPLVKPLRLELRGKEPRHVAVSVAYSGSPIKPAERHLALSRWRDFIVRRRGGDGRGTLPVSAMTPSMNPLGSVADTSDGSAKIIRQH